MQGIFNLVYENEDESFSHLSLSSDNSKYQPPPPLTHHYPNIALGLSRSLALLLWLSLPLSFAFCLSCSRSFRLGFSLVAVAHSFFFSRTISP